MGNNSRNRQADSKITPEDWMVVCMARQVENGELVVQGLATPLVAAAYLFARHTHAPSLYFASAIGQGICRQPAPLSLLNIESLWLDQAMITIGFVRAAADILPTLRPKEYFRPGQVDPHGNFNNIAFGDNYRRPRLRLPGTGGIPDVTTYIDKICLYVPRHSRITFVPKLDFLSGLGHNPARQQGAGPQCLISDLGEFDYADGRMRLKTFHPGTDIEYIKRKTGFPFEIAPDICPTEPPSGEELRLLQEEIDPLGIRFLESLSGAERHQRLQDIIDYERRQLAAEHRDIKFETN